MTGPDSAMARELEGLLASGSLDPSRMLADNLRFHSVFIAPFSPDFAAARQRFLADGGGPLQSAVAQLHRQGLPAIEAAAMAKRLIASAQGLCVAVIAGDHSIATVPQPFFGNLDADWRRGAVEAVAAPYRDGLAAALSTLSARGPRGWPRLVAGPAGNSDQLRAYWCDLARRCAATLKRGGHGDSRLADLGHWTAAAVLALAPSDLSAADHAALARCHLVAGESAAACAAISACAKAGDDESVVELFDALATTICARGGDPIAEAWLAETGTALAKTLGCPFDAALAQVRVAAASGAGISRLLPTVNALIAANRKLARQALMREPVWQVTVADPGELLDTAAAADLLARSPSFVAKRLDARTIPFHVHAEQVRLPRRALVGWKTVLDQHQLLD